MNAAEKTTSEENEKDTNNQKNEAQIMSVKWKKAMFSGGVSGESDDEEDVRGDLAGNCLRQ